MKKLRTQELEQKCQDWQSIADAFFRFVQVSAPKDFNLYGLMFAGSMGNKEMIVSLLDKYTQEKRAKMTEQGA